MSRHIDASTPIRDLMTEEVESPASYYYRMWKDAEARLEALSGTGTVDATALLRTIREHPACNVADCLHGDTTLANMIDEALKARPGVGTSDQSAPVHRCVSCGFPIHASETICGECAYEDDRAP